MKRKDDFKQATKDLLAKRVSYKCSNPTCRRPTVGPSSESQKTINIGVAAHITAASEGGPRFDADLDSLSRTSSENGIWLCQSCSTLIDSDKAKFTTEVLKSWKEIAEHLAASENQSLSLNRRNELMQIDFLSDKWETWVDSGSTFKDNITAISLFGRGNRAFNCRLRFRNRTDESQLLTKMRVQLRSGEAVLETVSAFVFNDDYGVEISPRVWRTLEACSAFPNSINYRKADSVWFIARIAGQEQDDRWKIADLPVGES